jgi:predicted ATPase/DNA-binding winged helix-turn-helix (wHTH) protein
MEDSGQLTERTSTGLPDKAFSFGEFRLFPAQRALFHLEERVSLGSRAFDILLALVERSGSIVSPDELKRIVWDGVVVDEANLRVQIGNLRKALSRSGGLQRTIETVPLKGYCFVLPVTSTPSPEPRPAASDAVSPGLPPLLGTIVGRDDSINSIAGALEEHRFVTIVGPGGIGKSTVAAALAQRTSSRYPDGVRHVDFCTLTDLRLVERALAAAVGLGAITDNPLAGLVAHLRTRNLLLILETCEHVADAVAPLAETLLASAPGIRILATSREALRASGEWVHHLPPLALPASAHSLGLRDALQSPAIQLLVDRASASEGALELVEEDVETLVSICRRLDGIPLAIELAAGRVGELGLAGVAHRLEESFSVLTQGRRTALPRHRTLTATFEWSYKLLSPGEKVLLQTLSIFRGPFTPDAACFIAGAHLLDQQDALEGLSSLFAKSLLTTSLQSDRPLYRMLDTTRAFASEKLRETEATPAVVSMHAAYTDKLVRDAETEWEKVDTSTWTHRHAHLIDDARCVLDWAFSTPSQAPWGASLVVHSSPLWFALSLLSEYGTYVEKALGVIEGLDDFPTDDRARLWEASGHVLWHTRGAVPEMAAAFHKALQAAEAQSDVRAQLRAIWGIVVSANANADYREAAAMLERFASLARTLNDVVITLTYHRLATLTQHYAGEHRLSRGHAEHLLRFAETPGQASQDNLQLDRRLVARSMLARDLFFLGFADQARRTAEESAELALSIGHALSYCFVLANAAIPIAFWTGDRATASTLTRALLQRTEEHAFRRWHSFGVSYRALLEAPGQVPSEAAVGFRLLETVATIDEAFASPIVLARAQEGIGGWSLPELLRVSAKNALRAENRDVSRAEALLLRSLAKAREQESLAWELRAGITLAELWAETDRRHEGAALLESIRRRFTEGHDTADFAQSTALLSGIGSAPKSP